MRVTYDELAGAVGDELIGEGIDWLCDTLNEEQALVYPGSWGSFGSLTILIARAGTWRAVPDLRSHFVSALGRVVCGGLGIDKEGGCV